MPTLKKQLRDDDASDNEYELMIDEQEVDLHLKPSGTVIFLDFMLYYLLRT